MRINPFFSKLLFVFMVLLLTYFYAQYEKQKYYAYNDDASSEQVLKQLPDFNTVESATGKTINSIEFLKGSNAIFVHVWGTWCPPCEREMPDFLKYAQAIQSRGIKVLMIAVNDEDAKVRKFMGRYTIPSNVTVVLDNERKVMDLFGTLKVPESFLFASSGKHINKFVGPQDWSHESYRSRLDFWLNPAVK